MTDSYNGWTNYATWRVNLEIFDGMSPEDIVGHDQYDAWQLETSMKDYAIAMIETGLGDNQPDQIVAGWARAFLADVNWTELARHKAEEYA